MCELTLLPCAGVGEGVKLSPGVRFSPQAPEGESQPMTEVDLFISTQRIKVLNADSQVRAGPLACPGGDVPSPAGQLRVCARDPSATVLASGSHARWRAMSAVPTAGGCGGMGLLLGPVP